MTLLARNIAVSIFRVEVSGWDKQQAFFVEKSELHWSVPSGKDFARKVARHYTNVLVVGATGTGKELVARAIHQISPVSSQKLAVCHCSALVDTLLESQLFGYVRGAFIGATDAQPGLFE